MERAYSILEIKSVDAERRRFSGIASTPDLDRQGHSLDPAGVRFRNPVPLLLHHNQTQPIGLVNLFHVPEGIAFEAEIPNVAERGTLKDRVDEAWYSVKAGLYTGVSIGYQILENAIERIASGGLRLLKTEIWELSLVTIPSNVHASIRLIKSLDLEPRPAPPSPSPGVAGLSRSRAHPMRISTADHIKTLEHSRAALVGRMVELSETAAGEGVTLEAAAAEEYDGIALKVKTIDGDLVRFRALEATQIAAAVPITPAPAPHVPAIRVVSNVPKGIGFLRWQLALVNCKSMSDAITHAARWRESTPQVETLLKAGMTPEILAKAAVAPGTIADPAWAGPLAVAQVLASEFLDLLRPATILGKLENLRKVPFNVLVPAQTAGGSYNWVGELKPKAVTKLAFANVTLGIAKAAGIIILSKELVKISNPSAEETCRNDMIKGISAFLDAQFIDPAVAEVVGVHPGSITNGTVALTSTGSALKDILALVQALSTANVPLAGITFIMSEANALALSFLLTANGQPLFPDVNAQGGTIKGMKVVTSNAAGGNVIAFQPSYILYADEGGVNVDMSEEASVQMSDAPDDPVTATSTFTSLWQNNLVGLRAERFINWKRAILPAVKYVSGAAYQPSAAELAAGGEGAAPAKKAS